MTGHAVAIACDAGYAPYAMVLAAQIAAAHPGRDFDICLFSPDAVIVPEGLSDLGVRVVRMPAENPYSGGAHEDRHGAAAYLRLLIPDLMAGEYRRILYLDCDIAVGGGGIGRLLRADLGGGWLGAVRDNQQWRSPGRRVAEFRATGRPARPYFNSGVLLVDVAAWQAAGIGARALTLFHEQGAVMTRHDQSVLNLLADGDWAEMSPLWNWQYTWTSRFYADLVEPRLVHFIGSRKPWNDTTRSLPARFRRPYVEAAVHWPEHPQLAAVDGDSPAWPPRLGRAFLRHWWAERRMRDYLARFPDAFALRRAE